MTDTITLNPAQWDELRQRAVSAGNIVGRSDNAPGARKEGE